MGPDPDRFYRERTSLRIVRLFTNMTLYMTLTGTAALLTGAALSSLAGGFACLAFLILSTDQIQHRIRGIRPYSLACLVTGGLFLLGSHLALPGLWPLHLVLVLAQTVWLYQARAGGFRLFAPRPGHILLPFGVWTLGIVMEEPSLKVLALAAEILLGLLYLAFLNLKSLDRTYTAASEKTRVPYRKIGRLNGLLLLAYLGGALLLCLGLMGLYAGDDLIRLVPRASMALFALFLGGILWLAVHLFPPEAAEAAAQAAEEAQAGLSGGTAAPWVRMLWTLLTWILGFFLLAILLAGLCRALQSFCYDFRSADPETGDTRKRTQAAETRTRLRRRRKRPLGFSPPDRIRRAYASLILSQPGAGEILASDTPSRLEEKAAGKAARESSAWQRIHVLYEKARYGEEASGRDLKELAEAKKELARGAGSGE